MREALDLEQLLYGQGYADRTVKEYVKWAKRLTRWCALHDETLPDLPASRLRDWIDQTVANSRESRKQAHAACKHLYTMLGRTDDPWTAIRIPKRRKGQPDPLTDGEAGQLRDAALIVGGRAGMATLGLLYTAARPGEVAGWQRSQIDLDGGTIRWWRPKVSDWHTVTLHPLLAEALERYLTPDIVEYLFAGDRGRAHVTGTTIWNWTKQIADTAGVLRVSPRRLRHTAGSKAANSTRDVAAAAALMGNSVEVASRYYTLIDQERREAAVAALDW